jgi:hypothetical protein
MGGMRQALVIVLVAGCWSGSAPPPAAPVATTPPLARPVVGVGGQGYGGNVYGGAFGGLVGTPDTNGVDPNTTHGLGTGGLGTIGHGSGTGSGYGVGRGGPAGKPNVPTVSVGQPVANGDLDKAIIRRYIKRNIQKIQYCYEKTLLAKPGLAGTVNIMFTIGAEGLVTATSGKGVDPDVADCVAGVIKDIEFPKPKNGVVVVNYPFVFAPAGN